MKRERENQVTNMMKEINNGLLQMLKTSFGPYGSDKMFVKNNKTVVTNDGATIMQYYTENPIHKILSDVSKTQDTNCGDGTTSATLLTCLLIKELLELKEKGVQVMSLTRSLKICKDIALEYINTVKIPMSSEDFISIAMTTLSSKIASNIIQMGIVVTDTLEKYSQSEIRVLKKVEGSIEDIKMFESILLMKSFQLDEEIKVMKVLLIQFPISAPKPNMDFNVEITNKQQMERFACEERDYVLRIVRRIAETGTTLLIVQKNLLRKSVSDLGMNYLNLMGIKCIDNVDRKEMTYLAKALRTIPSSDVELLRQPISVEVGEVEGFLELKRRGVSIVVKGCDEIVCEEAERNLHDALSVISCLKRDPFVVPGGCAIETGISSRLNEYTGPFSTIVHKISRAFFSLPLFIAQNTGLSSVETVDKLLTTIKDHPNLGLSMRHKKIADMIFEDRVIQPSAVNSSAVCLSFEAAEVVINIDDVLPSNY